MHAGAALHIWRQPNEAISEVARVLRPGGVFVASTFVRSERRRWQLLTEGFQATSRARVFAASSLENMCVGVGLGDFSPIRRGAFILFTATKQ